jgi:LacI family transcriptional regulator
MSDADNLVSTSARDDADRPSRPVQRPTMHDVAALARVSLKTVSRVVNQEPGVSPELARRVHQAAAQLDYRPNLAARSLRQSGGRTATIGLLLEDVSNPFSSSIHRAIEDAARARGVAVLASSLDEDPGREQELVRNFVSRRVDGLAIVPAATDHSYLVSERRAGLAVVFVDRPPGYLDADTVLAENREGARDGVRHLIAQGHRRIAFLGDMRSISTARDRFAGYRDALREASIDVNERLIRSDLHSIQAGTGAVEELLSGPADVAPTALFGSQNLVTVGALRALRRLELQQRVALVGFDDLMLGDLLQPGLTAVAQDPVAMGTAAAELLFRRMDGDTGATRRVTIPTRLIERGSGEIAPPRDGSGGSRRRR